MVAARPLPAGRAGAGPVCRAAFRPVGAVAGGVASRAPGSLGAGGGTFRSVPACRRTKGPAAGFDRMSFHRSAPFPLDCVIMLLPSLQKQVPSIGEQSTKFSQAHSREQFLP